MKLAVTGHRPSKIGNEYGYEGPYSAYIKAELLKQFEQLKPCQAISGMAQGVDTIFALIAIDLKIPLLACLPFEGQELRWPSKAQKLYWEILNHKLTTPYTVCEPGYEPEKMQVRNAFMVDECDVLIAVYNGTKGGTYNCLKYAQKKNKTIIIINPDQWNVKETFPQSLLF